MEEIKKTLKKEFEDHLNQVILPFWMNLRDNQYGGFYGYVDMDLNVVRDAVKGCILNNRILWFFSNAYMTLKRPELLDYESMHMNF